MKIKSDHYHEAGHTAYVLMETWERFVWEHRMVRKNKKLRKKAEKAFVQMFDTYQEIMVKMAEAQNKEKK